MGSSMLGIGLCSTTLGRGLQRLLPSHCPQGRPSLDSGQESQGLPLLYT